MGAFFEAARRVSLVRPGRHGGRGPPVVRGQSHFRLGGLELSLGRRRSAVHAGPSQPRDAALDAPRAPAAAGRAASGAARAAQTRTRPIGAAVARRQVSQESEKEVAAAFLRFTRDKRGYEHFYLVEPATNARGKSSARLLYWF